MPTYLTPGVYVEEIDSGSKPLSSGATAVAAFVGFTAKAPTDPTDPDGRRPRLVTNWTQFESLYGGFTPGAMLPHAVYGYFNNGGSIAYIVRIPHEQPKGDRPPLALAAGDGKPALEVTAKVPDPDLQVTVEPAPPSSDGDGEARFTILVESGNTPLETYHDVTLTKGDRFVETATAESTLVTIKVKNTTKGAQLAAGTFTMEPAPMAPVQVRDSDFAGKESERSGIGGLAIADDVTMVAVPDLITAATKADGTVDLDMWKAVQLALINHCEGEANRMAILDAPPGLGPQDMRDWRANVAGYDSMFAAMYYPWIKVANPVATNGDRIISVPPSGHMAGVWARTDETRGVWKAPANETVRGALDVETPMTKAEQGLLNPIGVNCIRGFGTRGIRIWGARTLSSNPSWNYLNVRRLFNMVETTIMDGTQWVVFEPNDLALWQKVKRTLNAYLTGLWREGALFGATPDEAFFVKCDAENNPPDSIDLGRLIVEVGIAPVKPAEFVIFRISQWQGGSAAAE
ncbi:MAG: phage tail sheath subtilisin-like domain-containing protein [Actinobacteria bacterium]|nr:phage tail sheath subtilisin-like domain-containing protein [Actinomycetota bacterium]